MTNFMECLDENGRPNHIEFALANMHYGGWFTGSDIKNKVYANL